MSREIIVIMLAVLFLSCKKNTKKITLFFNPARALHLTEMKFKVEFNNKVVFDTVVINSFVDKSLYMTDFRIKPAVDDILLIRINNKLLQIKNLDTFPNCSSIFASYDNFTQVLDKASQIEKRKINAGSIADYKLIVDSLKKSAQTADFYDKIEVIIKSENCKD